MVKSRLKRMAASERHEVEEFIENARYSEVDQESFNKITMENGDCVYIGPAYVVLITDEDRDVGDDYLTSIADPDLSFLFALDENTAFRFVDPYSTGIGKSLFSANVRGIKLQDLAQKYGLNAPNAIVVVGRENISNSRLVETIN